MKILLDLARPPSIQSSQTKWEAAYKALANQRQSPSQQALVEYARKNPVYCVAMYKYMSARSMERYPITSTCLKCLSQLSRAKPNRSGNLPNTRSRATRRAVSHSAVVPCCCSRLLHFSACSANISVYLSAKAESTVPVSSCAPVSLCCDLCNTTNPPMAIHYAGS
ncbi:hypothetical protein VTK56DRAFT_4630 [Thermocarpiscus australiensis]